MHNTEGRTSDISNRRVRIAFGLACLVWVSITYFPQESKASNISTSSTPSGPAGGALTGTYPNPTLLNLLNVESIPFVVSNGILGQDQGFSFNASGSVTPTAGQKILNIASSNNAAGIVFTSNNLTRGQFGAVSGGGMRWGDQGGAVVLNGTYSTNNMQVGGATDAGYKFDIAASGTNGALRSPSYHTTTNCASAGGTCGAAAAGSVSIVATATTVTVATTAVTANSNIFLSYDSTLGTKLGVTCNAAVPAAYSVSARTAATSFQITSSVAVGNSNCFNYWIVD